MIKLREDALMVAADLEDGNTSVPSPIMSKIGRKRHGPQHAVSLEGTPGRLSSPLDEVAAIKLRSAPKSNAVA